MHGRARQVRGAFPFGKHARVLSRLSDMYMHVPDVSSQSFYAQVVLTMPGPGTCTYRGQHEGYAQQLDPIRQSLAAL